MARSNRLGLVVVVGALGVGAWLWWGAGPEAGPAVTGGEAQGAAPALRADELRDRPELVLSPRLGERASIAGTIRDRQGQPIAGAQVCASVRSPLLTVSETRRPTCVTSARDGHYRIEGLFGVRQMVTASAPGFIPAIYRHGEGASRRGRVDLRPGMEVLGVDLELADGGVEIRGVVKDLSGGAVEGAQVSADISFATTGVDGEFSMWVRAGDMWVSAQADGYASGTDSGAAPGHFFEVFLTPEAVIVGKVVRAEDGAPVEGAGLSTSAGRGFAMSGPEALSDANGDFRIDGLHPGVYKPRAEADDAFGLAEEQVVLGLGETSAPIVIKAHPAFFVEGQIVIEGGGSCDSGSVNLRDKAKERGGRGQVEPDGTVRVRGMLPGEYQVSVFCEGYVSAERYDRVTIADRSVPGLRWEVTRGQAIRGVVVDAAGKPVEKMHVGADAKQDPSQPRAQQTNASGGDTDAQGRFELTGLLPGKYELSLAAWTIPRATPRKPTTVSLPRGQDVDGVRIELPATGEVRGVVRDPQGRPVSGVQVNLTDGAHSHYAAAADDGSFHFASVAAGEYRATAMLAWESMRAPGTSDDDVQGEKVEVRDGKTETVKLVVEGASGTITGIVRDEDGGPVADAFVQSTRESDSAATSSGSAARWGRWSWKKPNLTDVDGRFSLAELPPGKHTLRAHRKGGGEAILEHVEIGGDVVLTIASAGRMSGTVSVRGGAAPEEFSVRIVDESTGFQRNDRFYRTGGAWSLPEVPAGKYKVSVSAGAGTAEVEASMSAGQDTAGVRIELLPKVTVRGKVVDLEGKPVAGLEVTVRGKNSSTAGGGDEAKLNVTDESGRYEVANAPTGAVYVSVWPRSWSRDSEYEPTGMPAVISTDAAVVELAEIRVARRRVKAGEAQGDLGYKLKEAEPGADPMTRRLIVAFVRPNGPAAAAGLQAGDEITSVDGQDVTGPSAYLYGTLTRVLEGTVVNLGLARGASLQVTAGEKP